MRPQHHFPGVVKPRVPRAMEDWSGNVKDKQMLTRGALPQYTFTGAVLRRGPRAAEDWSGKVKGKEILPKGVSSIRLSWSCLTQSYPGGDFYAGAL